MKIGTLDINNLYVGGSQASAAYLGSTQVYPSQPTGQPNDEIWYASDNGQIIEPNVSFPAWISEDTAWTANIVSNTYSGGKGVIKFDDDITTIPAAAFCDNTGLTSISIPGAVEYISESAFDTCQSLSSVTIPNSVTGISEYAFNNIAAAELNIPDSVTVIKRRALSRNINLSSVTIGSGLTTLADTVFDAPTSTGSSLTAITYNGSISMWNAITKTAAWADNSVICLINCTDGVIIAQRDVPANELWYATTDATTTTGQGLSPTSNSYNSGIGKMEFVGNLTAIPDSAFSGNSKVVAVFVSSAVTTIGAYAFASCPNLECASFAQKSASVTVKTRVFEESTKLLAIKMPQNISFQSGAEYVFNTDTSLRYIDMPANLPQVIIGLFNRCYSLTKLHLPSTISNTIGANGLRFSYTLMNLSYNGTVSQWNAKTKNSNWNRFVPATGITCTDGVATIDDSFTITGRTLNTNKSMIAITSAVSDVVDGYDSSVFMAVTGASNASVLFLSDNSVITSVGNRTFYQSSLLTELRLPPSLTTISQGFCDSCPNLYRLVYCGTMAQWKALWQNSTGSETAVVANCPNLKEVECKDGILPVEQA